MQSVTIVVNTDDEMAGSAPKRVEQQRDQDAGKRRRQHVDDHRAGDHQAEIGIAKHRAGDEAEDARNDRAVEQPDHHLAADDAAGIVDVEVAGRQRAHGHRHRLRAGIAAQRGDDRHQHGQRHHLLDRAVEDGDDRRRQEGRAEIDQQPRHARARRRKDRVGQFFVADAAHAHQIFLGLLLDDVDHVVDGEHADQPLVLVDDGGRQEVVLLELARRLFLVHGRRNRVPGLMHDVFDLDRALGAQDLVEVDGAEQLEGRVDDEDLAEAVGQVLVIAHVVDGLADRPEWRHRHELGLHAPAGGLFRIVERAPQPDALGERQLRQDLVLVLLVEVFQDVDGVVGIELLDGLGDLLVGQIVDDVEADRLVDLGQRGKVEVLAEQFDQRAALLGHQRLEQVAQFRLVQATDVLLERQRIAIGDGRADMRQERGKDDTVLAIDVGGRHIGGVGLSVFVLTFHRAPFYPGKSLGQV